MIADDWIKTVAILANIALSHGGFRHVVVIVIFVVLFIFIFIVFLLVLCVQRKNIWTARTEFQRPLIAIVYVVMFVLTITMIVLFVKYIQVFVNSKENDKEPGTWQRFLFILQLVLLILCTLLISRLVVFIRLRKFRLELHGRNLKAQTVELRDVGAAVAQPPSPSPTSAPSYPRYLSPTDRPSLFPPPAALPRFDLPSQTERFISGSGESLSSTIGGKTGEEEEDDSLAGNYPPSGRPPLPTPLDGSNGERLSDGSRGGAGEGGGRRGQPPAADEYLIMADYVPPQTAARRGAAYYVNGAILGGLITIGRDHIESVKYDAYPDEFGGAMGDRIGPDGSQLDPAAGGLSSSRGNDPGVECSLQLNHENRTAEFKVTIAMDALKMSKT